MIFFLIFFISQMIYPTDTQREDREWLKIYYEQPMYFLIGTPDTKVQFSLKAKVLPSTNLYVAYTQRIFWDLFKTSRPFKDVNYNPYLFYRIYFLNDSESIIDIIIYEHESNGKGEENSRSLDQIGIRYQASYLFQNEFKLTWSVHLWVPFNFDSTNTDISEYRGVYEIICTLSNFMGSSFEFNDLSFRFYPGGKLYINPLQGGRELTLRLKGKSKYFFVNIVFQIFQGYGETMLDYKKSIWGFRAGIGF